MMLTSSTTSHWRASLVEILITRACDPSLHEPSHAINLQVAEYIKSKKANSPREAAMLAARLANNRNPRVALLALSLLDTLVKQCGHPFHLQVSSKEFLDELVRRSAERPPSFPGAVMLGILDLIHIWKEGICVESRWREDLENIRDMHCLLTSKGYRFRDSPGRHQLNLDAAVNLKSAEELEEEDREAQSAKLQELIRRGTPRDLDAAQELMKSLAGADPDAKPDYRLQALTELHKLEQKVILLSEMLDNTDTERNFTTGDPYDQVSSIVTAARPKLQKWISDAQTDDTESLETFRQINDQISTVLNRYEAFKKGDYATSSNPIPTELSGGAANDLSLIDFDDGSSSAANPISLGSCVEELGDLFSAHAPAVPTAPHASLPMLSNGMGYATVGPVDIGISRPTMALPSLLGTQPASIMLPGAPGLNTQPAPAMPNYFGGNTCACAATGPVLGMGMGAVSASSPAPALQAQKPQMPVVNAGTPNQMQQGRDPFADLAGLL